MLNLKPYVLMSWIAYIGLMAASALLQNMWLFFSGIVLLGVMLIRLMLNLKKKYASD